MKGYEIKYTKEYSAEQTTAWAVGTLRVIRGGKKQQRQVRRRVGGRMKIGRTRADEMRRGKETMGWIRMTVDEQMSVGRSGRTGKSWDEWMRGGRSTLGQGLVYQSGPSLLLPDVSYLTCWAIGVTSHLLFWCVLFPNYPGNYFGPESILKSHCWTISILASAIMVVFFWGGGVVLTWLWPFHFSICSLANLVPRCCTFDLKRPGVKRFSRWNVNKSFCVTEFRVFTWLLNDIQGPSFVLSPYCC